MDYIWRIVKAAAVIIAFFMIPVRVEYIWIWLIAMICTALYVAVDD